MIYPIFVSTMVTLSYKTTLKYKSFNLSIIWYEESKKTLHTHYYGHIYISVRFIVVGCRIIRQLILWHTYIIFLSITIMLDSLKSSQSLHVLIELIIGLIDIG